MSTHDLSALDARVRLLEVAAVRTESRFDHLVPDLTSVKDALTEVAASFQATSRESHRTMEAIARRLETVEERHDQETKTRDERASRWRAAGWTLVTAILSGSTVKFLPLFIEWLAR